jgi:hypothetical protein
MAYLENLESDSKFSDFLTVDWSNARSHEGRKLPIVKIGYKSSGRNTRDRCYKTFYGSNLQKLVNIVLDKPFQPIVMAVSKVGAFMSEAPFKVSTLALSPCFTHKH